MHDRVPICAYCLKEKQHTYIRNNKKDLNTLVEIMFLRFETWTQANGDTEINRLFY